jgi:RNA polymerase sigma-70 factor (family 1)
LKKENNTDILSLINEMVLNDSQKAFKSLFLLYYQQIMRFVLLRISNYQDAEEIVSDVFSAVWANRNELLNINSFDSYLYSIARHKIMDIYRKNNKNEQVVLDESNFQLFGETETSPEDNCISKEEIDRMNNAIEELPSKCKMVFKLVREDRLKYKDVARIMNISEKTVEAQVSIALKKLRQVLRSNKDSK